MDADAMNDHWRKVKRDREAKYGGSDRAIDGDSSENEYMRALRGD